jgi:hypothetical protein
MKLPPERFHDEEPGSTDPSAKQWKGGPQLSPRQRFTEYILSHL